MLVEERARRILQELLIGREREVHGQLLMLDGPWPSMFRDPIGADFFRQTSTRSPMTFFWISDEPE